MPLLSGVRVVDFTANAAGPYCTMLLADMGAEVIKVEPPSGDSARGWGRAREDRRSFLFMAVNRNKRSIVLDLKSPEDAEVARRLIESADVVVESFAPGAAARLNIGYDDCRALKPDLVYCSVSGFGQTGPLRAEPGFDMMLQAYTGIMSMNGEPGTPPARVPVSALDLMTGSFAYSAILASLWRREQKGLGERIDTSLYDTAVNLLCYAVPEYSATGSSPGRHGSAFPYLAPYEVFEAGDDFFYLGVGTESAWQRACQLLGQEALLTDPRFTSNPQRVDNREALRGILRPIFATKPAAQWVTDFAAVRIPAALIRSVGDALDDDHCRERGATAELPGMPGMRVASHPVKYDAVETAPWTEPPLLGQHSREIRNSLGL